MMLAGCRVVVTRPAAQAEELARPLREAGAEVLVRPLVRIAAPADGGAALRSCAARMQDYAWLVLTSVNAVEQVVQAAAGSAAWPRVACVGEATARAARTHGLQVALVPSTHTAEALASALLAEADLAGARVLWPRASGARDVLRTALERAGAQVDDPEAYRTVLDAEAGAQLRRELAASPVTLVTMTSPSAVHAFGVGYDGAIGVIGRVTRAAAEAAGLRVEVEAGVAGVAGLVAAIASWYAGRA